MNLKKNSFIIYGGIIAVCFLYTGSAYMSQFYRLVDYYNGAAVDIITSGLNYVMQAIGIILFSFGLWRKPSVWGNKHLFIALLTVGCVFMAISQIALTGWTIVLSGLIFNILIGTYFGFYLTMLSAAVPSNHVGLCYGTAYAIGSAGTYIFSLINNGNFLISVEIIIIYIILAAVTIGLVLTADNIVIPARNEQKPEKPKHILWMAAIIVIMMIITTTGSGLYYSLPQAENVNWNFIRVFYAFGLIIAGFVYDKSRFAGGIAAVASLTYPLIATALIGNGVTGTIVLAFSYLFRGFLSVYCVCTFTDLGKESSLLPWAPMGLAISRITEAVLSFVIIYIHLSDMVNMIFTAAMFVPLIIVFAVYQKKLFSVPVLTDEKRLALFAEKYGLTARETEILNCLTDGLSDDEISDMCYISKSTVRFHISNLLKKTSCDTRVDVVRALQKFN